MTRKPFPFIAPGRSDDLMLGETVIAIGNPLGLGHSVTTGVVSAASRRVPIEQGVVGHFIQTDALINPGNSGGPLLNINGELIGINTAIASQAQGIGFSIPIDLARRVAADLIEHGQPPAGLARRPARRRQCRPDPQPRRRRRAGHRGRAGFAGGRPPGFELADVILALDGEEVESPAELLQLLSSYTPEDRIRLQVAARRAGAGGEVALAPLPEGTACATPSASSVWRPRRRAGGEGDPGDPRTRRRTRSGCSRAIWWREVGGQRLKQVADLGAYLDAHLGELPQSFLFVRGSRGYYVDLP